MSYRPAKVCLWTLALTLLLFAIPLEKSPERIVADGFCPITSAHAVVGRPLTPVSYAGVARRTSRRTARRVSRRY